MLLRDNKKTRWMMMFIISFVMFAAYVASDNIFSVETDLLNPTDGCKELTQKEITELKNLDSSLVATYPSKEAFIAHMDSTETFD